VARQESAAGQRFLTSDASLGWNPSVRSTIQHASLISNRLPVFRRLLHELDSVIMDTKALATQQHGVVRIAALPSFAAGLLPAIISRFRRSNPRMALS